MPNKIEKEIKNYEKTVKKKKSNYSWILKVTLFATITSFLISYSSEIIISKLSLIASIIFLIIFIAIGVIADMIGVAITTVPITPFHSMNSKRMRGSKKAIKLIQNAEKVASFANDVVGDICGILSGSIGILISTAISLKFNFNLSLTSLIVTALVAGLMIGGKAIGKSIAINKNVYIVYELSRLISVFEK